MNKSKSLWIAVIAIWVLVFLVSAAKLVMSSNATSLDKETKFQHNGKEFKTGSFTYKGRIFVPLRKLSEQMGFTVKFDKIDKTIDIYNKQYSSQFKLGSKFIYLYGEDSIEMDVEPMIIDNTTYIPVRYAVESLGKFIEIYNDKNLRIINITDYNPAQEVLR